MGNEIAVRDEKGRFLPGNPIRGGRPKGSKNKISFVVVDALEDMSKDGNKTNLEAIMDVLLSEALVKKNLKAIEILLDRGYGKAKEFVEVSTPEVVVIDSLGDEEEEDDKAGGSETSPS